MIISTYRESRMTNQKFHIRISLFINGKKLHNFNANVLSLFDHHLLIQSAYSKHFECEEYISIYVFFFRRERVDFEDDSSEFSKCAKPSLANVKNM